MQAWKHNESWSASCSSYNRPVEGDESQQLNFPYILQVSLVSKLYRDTRTVDHWHNFGVAELAFIFTEIPKILVVFLCVLSHSFCLQNEDSGLVQEELAVGSRRSLRQHPHRHLAAAESSEECRTYRGYTHRKCRQRQTLLTVLFINGNMISDV